MTIELTCLCKNLRLRIDAEPIVGFWCHCEDCRAAHGAAYVGVALFPSSAVTISAGEAAAFTIRSLPRSFCQVCGTRMFACVPNADVIGIVATRLPDDKFRPEFHIHCVEALAPVKDDLPHFAGLPAIFGGIDRTVDW
jgi:hypothetical protein